MSQYREGRPMDICTIGAGAALAREPRMSNPHPNGSKDRQEWFKGYDRAYRQLNKTKVTARIKHRKQKR